jgi:hypothetical protein
MTPRHTQFIRKVVTQAVETVGRGDAHDSRLCFSAPGMQFPVWITTEICPPRHGCGFEQDSYWSHTNDADLFAASHGASFSEARNNWRELPDLICAYIERELAGAEKIEAKLIFFPHPGQGYLPMLEGDSDSNYLRDIPEFNGI